MNKQGNIRLFFVCIAVAVAIFLFDLTIPLGMAGGVPYVALVLLGMWAPKTAHIFILAGAGTVLTILGYVLSDAGGVPWVVLVNRGMAFFVIWSTAVLVAHRKQRQDALDRSHEELEARVLQRTAALHESEERFRALSDLTEEGVVIHKDGKIVEVNQAFAEMSGYVISELIGMPVLELAAPENRQIAADRITSHAGNAYKGKNIRKDGSQYSIEVKSLPIVYKGLQMLVSRVRDLTEAEEAAAAVRESENRYKNITDNLPVLIAYIDRDQRYRAVNKQYEFWYQRPVSEIVGRRLNEIMLPGSYAQVSASIDRALAGEMVLNEGEGTTPDGFFRNFRLHYIPHRGDDGEVMGIYSLVEDISDIRKVTRELELQSTRLSEAQRIGNIGSWERDFVTGGLYWSEEAYEIFGQSDKTSPGPSQDDFMLLVHENDRAKFLATREAMIEKDAPFSIDHRIRMAARAMLNSSFCRT